MEWEVIRSTCSAAISSVNETEYLVSGLARSTRAPLECRSYSSPFRKASMVAFLHFGQIRRWYRSLGRGWWHHSHFLSGLSLRSWNSSIRSLVVGSFINPFSSPFICCGCFALSTVNGVSILRPLTRFISNLCKQCKQVNKIYGITSVGNLTCLAMQSSFVGSTGTSTTRS